MSSAWKSFTSSHKDFKGGGREVQNGTGSSKGHVIIKQKKKKVSKRKRIFLKSKRARSAKHYLGANY